MTVAPAAAILIGANQIREQIMPDYPDWDQMSDQQKLDYLREWCERMTKQIERHGAWINDLSTRLQKVEAKVGP